VALTVRPFRSADAPRVAEIVHRCLREVNSRDYPADIIDRMCAHFTAERFIELSRYRLAYVAVDHGIGEDERVVGTVSRDGNRVYSMFVDPVLAGRGIGRRLMQHIETLAADDGFDHMETGASLTAHGFYLKLGYTDVRETETEFGFNHILRKPLSRPDPPGDRRDTG
jgi:GNAT superfamily N-acetyltransferase